MWEGTGMRHIKVLGITGGVGAGKSTVLAYLEERYGAKVIQLDRVAHELMEPGGICYRRILDTFGEDLLERDGTISRTRLYQKTFGDREKVEQLNKMVHPMVKLRVKELLEEERMHGDAPFAVLEAALLLEDHYEEICDQIWFICVDRKVRVRRLRESRGYSEEKTEEILKNQKKDEEFRILCQFEVDNSSDILENTYGQIDRGLKENGFL